MAELKFVDLEVDNLFDACTMLDAIGTEEILKAFDVQEINGLFGAGKDSSSIGLILVMKVCGIVIRYMPKARDEICAFFAGCVKWDNGTAVTAEEIRTMKIGPFMTLIREFFKRDDLVDFFRQVVELLGMGSGNSPTPSLSDSATEQKAISVSR